MAADNKRRTNQYVPHLQGFRHLGDLQHGADPGADSRVNGVSAEDAHRPCRGPRQPQEEFDRSGFPGAIRSE